MANQNPSQDLVAIGGSIAAVGIGTQIPALGGVAASLINTCSTTMVGAAVKFGAGFAASVVGTVGAPVLIIGGLAIVGYEIFRN